MPILPATALYYLYGMKIQLLVIGKTRSTELDRLCMEYLKRLQRYIPAEINVVPDVKRAKNESPDQLKIREGAKLLETVQAGDLLFLLDERGKAYSSTEFAAFIQKQLNSGRKRMILAIGGAYGFSEAVYKRADGQLQLSRMTFSHEMVRLFLLEQLYRACTILKGEPYHHN